MAKRNNNDVATGAEVVPNGAAAGKMKRRNPEVDQKMGTQQSRKSNQNGNDTTHSAKRLRLEERTDYTRWRMRDDESRHTWHYLEDDEAVKEWPQTLADKYYLGLPLVRQPETTVPGSPSPMAYLTFCSCRNFRSSRERRDPSMRLGTDSTSLKSSSCRPATGAANMAGQCSSSRASS